MELWPRKEKWKPFGKYIYISRLFFFTTQKAERRTSFQMVKKKNALEDTISRYWDLFLVNNATKKHPIFFFLFISFFPAVLQPNVK